MEVINKTMDYNHDPKRLDEYATVEEKQGKAVWTCLKCDEVVKIFAF